MKPPKFLGKIVYFFGHPIFRKLIKNTTRAYVIVLVEEQMLVTKNWLGYQKKWRLPGGGVQPGEQPITAAQRELKEEVGISVHEQNLELLRTDSFKSSLKYQYFLYVLRLPEMPALTIDNKEILSAEFVYIHELAKMQVSEEVINFLRLAK
jgi:ADP-ribose pyrophosphatase YjhB (NUDIX family)